MGIKDWFSKAGSNASQAAKATGAVARKNVGGGTSESYFPTARAAGTVVREKAVGMGSAVKGDVVETVSDYGFILFIFGFVIWLLNFMISPTMKLVLAIILMFYSVIFIFQRRGLILVSIFWLWYIIFSARTDMTFLIYFGSISALVIMGYGFIKKGQDLDKEIYGLIPIIIFFLDIGLMDLLVIKFDLVVTPLLQNLLLFMPWWAILGLFTSKKESKLLGLLKFVGILYLVIVLIVGVIPDVGYFSTQSNFAGSEQFLQAQANLKAQFPDRENPFVSNLLCIAELANFPECVALRQETSELGALCKKDGQKEGTTEFTKCVDQKREEKKKEHMALQVGGANDASISQPTTANFKDSQYFPKEIFKQPGEALKQNFMIDFKVENPRKQGLDLEFSCKFIQGNKNVSGKIVGKATEQNVATESIVRTIVCKPENSEDMKGSYDVIYEAKIKNLKSVSRLQRAFLPVVKDDATRNGLVKEIKSTYFSGSNYKSQGAADLARIDFAFGNPAENPIIEPSENIVFSSLIKNTGSGKIIGIKKYGFSMNKIGLTEVGFSVASGEEDCLNGGAVELSKSSSQGSVNLPTCFINIPDNLKNIKDYQFREFEGEVVYDYLITRQTQTIIKSVELT